MDIKVVCGVGTGKTVLSAFDSALKDAGVYNYNLITLSSIIPPNARVLKVRQFKSPPEEYGHKLYVVKAEQRSEEAGKFIAAGIGWYQLEDGRGIFVEHEIKGETKVADESKMQFAISQTQIKDSPTCVLVLAVFQSEGWL